MSLASPAIINIKIRQMFNVFFKAFFQIKALTCWLKVRQLSHGFRGYKLAKLLKKINLMAIVSRIFQFIFLLTSF